MPLAFIAIWLVSVLDKSAQAKRERALFDDQKVRSETGIGAAKASSHGLAPGPDDALTQGS